MKNCTKSRKTTTFSQHCFWTTTLKPTTITKNTCSFPKLLTNGRNNTHHFICTAKTYSTIFLNLNFAQITENQHTITIFIENVNLGQQFSRRLIRIVLSRISTTSKLILSHFGRHVSVNTENTTNLRVYKKRFQTNVRSSSNCHCKQSVEVL